MIINNFYLSNSLSSFTENDISRYIQTFRRRLEKEEKQRDLHISHSLPGKLQEIEAQCSFHVSSVGKRSSSVDYLCIYHPFFPQNHNSRIIMSISSHPLGPGTGRNRWRSISSTNGIARNHLRRQSNLGAPVGRRDPRSFPASNGRAGNAHLPLLHRSAPLCCLRGGVDQ